MCPGAKRLQRLFRARGALPADAFGSHRKAEAWKNATQKRMSFNMHKLDRVLKKDIGTDLKPSNKAKWEVMLKRINRVLIGEEDVGSLPAEYRPVVLDMRAHVDQLSNDLIATGAVEGKLVRVISNNLGSYLHRSYRVFDDPKWSEKVPEEVRNRAKGFLREQLRELSDQQIDAEIESLLYHEDNSPMAALARLKKLGKKDLSVLISRSDVPLEIRELWGERLLGDQNYINTIAKVSALISNQKFLSEMKEFGMGSYLFTADSRPPDAKARISAEGNPRMAPLDGLYTFPSINEALVKMATPDQIAGWTRTYMKINGSVKYSKTVLSQTTHVRNFVSNIQYAIANGNLPMGNNMEAAKVLLQDFSPRSQKFQNKYQRYVELGVLDDSVHANELKAVLNDALSSEVDMAEFAENRFKRYASKAIGVVNKMYSAEDGFWKIVNFEAERKKLKNALPDKPDSEIDAEAAEIVQNVTPSYSLVPPAIQALRRFPAIGSFVSFSSEVIRNNWNIIKRMNHELATPELRGIGARRAIGFFTAHFGTVAAITALGRLVSGISPEEEEDLREFAAPWDKNGSLLFLGKTEDGQPRFVNLSYSDPFAVFGKTGRAALREDSLIGAVAAGVKEMAEPFVSPEILSTALAEIQVNKKVRGGEIYKETDSSFNKAQAISAHLWKAFEPGVINQYRRVYKGAAGIQDKYRNYVVKDELTALFTGQRIVSVDPAFAMTFKSKGFKRNRIDSQSIFTDIAKNPGTVSDGELESAFNSMEVAYQENYDSMRESVRAAISLGVTHEEMERILKSEKVSSSDREKLFKDPGASANWYMSRQMFNQIVSIPGRYEQIWRVLGSQAFHDNLPMLKPEDLPENQVASK